MQNGRIGVHSNQQDNHIDGYFSRSSCQGILVPQNNRLIRVFIRFGQPSTDILHFVFHLRSFVAIFEKTSTQPKVHVEAIDIHVRDHSFQFYGLFNTGYAAVSRTEFTANLNIPGSHTVYECNLSRNLSCSIDNTMLPEHLF